MPARRPIALGFLAFLVGAAPAVARAETLAVAVQRWTGALPDVFGAGPRVTIAPPRAGRFPAITAEAQPATRAGESGWQLSDLAVVLPVRLDHGAALTSRQQDGTAWLGETTMQANAAFNGIAAIGPNGTARLDHATVALSGDAASLTLVAALDGFHIAAIDAAQAALLPRHLGLRAHTGAGGSHLMAALLRDEVPPGTKLVIDAADLSIGPAHFTASGTVTVRGRDDRAGDLMVTATGFKELLRQMPTSGPATAAYPVLMILRQMGHKQAGGLSWTITFAGDKVLVEGLDLGPLLTPQ